MTNYGVTDPQSGEVTQVAPDADAPAPDAAAVEAPESDTEAVTPDPEVVAESDKALESKDAADKQAAEDAQFHTDNPNVPLVRAANPEVGGESF